MIYREHKVAAELSGVVKCIWALHAPAEAFGAERSERILPDGCIEMVFNMGGRYRQLLDNGSDRIQPTSFVHGQLKSYIEICATGHTHIMGIRFYPHGLAAVTAMPINELTEATITIEELFGAGGRALEQQMMNAIDDDERAAIINSFLKSRLHRPNRDNDRIAHVLKQLTNRYQCHTIGRLAREVNISERQLERLFSAHVGLSPKMFARICRFQRLFEHLNRKKPLRLTDLALDIGYYDQAHFIRDFKAFSGKSPHQYFSGNHTMSDYFTGLQE